MRHLGGWLSVVVFACGCGGNNLPYTPTPTAPVTVTPAPSRETGNWLPWSFAPWRPGVGPALAIGAIVTTAVEVDELCVPDIYWQWGARACSRFVVSVPSEGWLHAFLRWDASAPAFDMNLAGEVVLVASTGRFASSDYKQIEPSVFAKVEPGIYDVLIMSYGQGRLPFQLRTELRPN